MAGTGPRGGHDGLQLLRPDRVHRRFGVLPADRRLPPVDRPARAQPACLRPGRGAASRAGGNPRRALPGGHPGGARLPEPPGAHRRSLRGLPVRRAGCSDVPHRGPGGLERRRCAGVPGPCRRAGQDPRLSRRAGRGRGGAARAPGSGRNHRRGTGDRGWPQATRRLPRAGRLDPAHRVGAAVVAQAEPPRLHGPFGVRRAGPAPARVHREGRPAGVACAGSPTRGGVVVRGPAHGHGAGAGADLGGGPRGGAGGGRGQLLQPGR